MADDKPKVTTLRQLRLNARCKKLRPGDGDHSPLGRPDRRLQAGARARALGDGDANADDVVDAFIATRIESHSQT